MAMELEGRTSPRGTPPSVRPETPGARWAILVGLAVVAIFGGLWAFDASRLYLDQAYASGSYTYDLFFNTPAVWLLPLAVVFGIFFGAAKATYARPILVKDQVWRHDAGTFFTHWGVALATFTLMGTGIFLGSEFSPRLVSSTETVGLNLNLHFIAAVVFLFVSFYHVAHYYLREGRKEILWQKGDGEKFRAYVASMFGRGHGLPEGKYQASEKLAYLAWAVLFTGIIVTGFIKVAAHIWLDLSGGLMAVTTWLHDLFAWGTILLLVVHVVMVLRPSYWPILKSMFTGFVSEKFVREHHALWQEEIEKGEGLR